MKAETRCSRQLLIPVPVGSDRFSMADDACSCTFFTRSLWLLLRFRTRRSEGPFLPDMASVSSIKLASIRIRMLCNVCSTILVSISPHSKLLKQGAVQGDS